MAGIFQRDFAGGPSGLASAADELSAWLDAEQVPARAALLARLALDELVSNALRYGAGDGQALSVRFRCALAGGEIVVEVEDDGYPFDPRGAAEPELDLPLEQQAPGGRGIHLLRSLASRFDYERRSGRNLVRLAADAHR